MRSAAVTSISVAQVHIQNKAAEAIICCGLSETWFDRDSIYTLIALELEGSLLKKLSHILDIVSNHLFLLSPGQKCPFPHCNNQNYLHFFHVLWDSKAPLLSTTDLATHAHNQPSWREGGLNSHTSTNEILLHRHATLIFLSCGLRETAYA